MVTSRRLTYRHATGGTLEPTVTAADATTLRFSGGSTTLGCYRISRARKLLAAAAAVESPRLSQLECFLLGAVRDESSMERNAVGRSALTSGYLLPSSCVAKAEQYPVLTTPGIEIQRLIVGRSGMCDGRGRVFFSPTPPGAPTFLHCGVSASILRCPSCGGGRRHLAAPYAQRSGHTPTLQTTVT